ncbi:DEAD DEAH box helicase domain containing protein, putative [Babesia ovis]|uniref:DEAD DEAH box helicase domain containing protein, putative n=1 Tax=Babesia ovis TaxID=5869 RepID=A0A9W5TD05_BABOV|nr:DEAD DEAH box helicase domain containing protein, putative [Babesia ovis]
MMGAKYSVPVEETGDFTTLRINEKLKEKLEGRGIVTPSRHQYTAIKAMIQRSDLILQSKSGTGKTMSFCVALLQLMLLHMAHLGITPCKRKDGEDEEVVKLSTQLKSAKLGNGMDSQEQMWEKAADDVESYDDDVEDSDDMDVSLMKTNSGIVGGEGNTNVRTFGDAIILAPTRELAAQICRTLYELAESFNGVRVALVVGGANIIADINDLINTAPQIIVATPGRLLTTLKKTRMLHRSMANDKQRLFWNTQLMILDEADMLLDEHFFDQTKNICVRVVNPFVQMIATSATFIKVQFRLYEEMIAEQDKDFSKRLLPYLGSNTEQTYRVLQMTFGNHVANSINTIVEENQDKIAMMKKMKADEELIIFAPSDGEYAGGQVDSQLDSNHTPNRVLCDYNDIEYGQLHVNFQPVIDYLNNFSRTVMKIIVSASHVNRLELPTNHVICFAENDCLQDIKGVTEAVEEGNSELLEQSNTAVLKTIVFCYAEVPEAPNIVKQISLKLKIVIELLKRMPYRKCIIFSNQSHTRMLTANALERLGLACSMCSSRQSTESRRNTVQRVHNTRSNILIAADLISRGIHIDNVDLIINMDLPNSKETFLHRAGRTGRYGKSGICVCLCTKPEMETLGYLEYSLNFKCSHIEDVIEIDHTDESNSESHELFRTLDQMSHPEQNVEDAENGDNIETNTGAASETDEQAEETNVVDNEAEIVSENSNGVREETFNQSLREPIVASIHSSLFPGLMEYIIPAYSIMGEKEVYLEGVEPLGISGPGYGSVDQPTSENTFRLKFVEFQMAKVVLHISYDLYNAMSCCDRGEDFMESFYHIVAVQHGGVGISILDPINHIFKPIKGMLVISVVGRKDALELLSGLMTMVNLDFLVHQDNLRVARVVPMLDIYKNLADFPSEEEYTKARALVVDLFQARFVRECEERRLMYVNVVIRQLIQRIGSTVPAAFILAYQMVSQELYATGTDVLGIDAVENQRARSITLKNPYEMFDYIS